MFLSTLTGARETPNLRTVSKMSQKRIGSALKQHAFKATKLSHALERNK